MLVWAFTTTGAVVPGARWIMAADAAELAPAATAATDTAAMAMRLLTLNI
jgi:hypothetical protein